MIGMTYLLGIPIPLAGFIVCFISSVVFNDDGELKTSKAWPVIQFCVAQGGLCTVPRFRMLWVHLSVTKYASGVITILGLFPMSWLFKTSS
ncbi:hypothetical protein V8C34DRAFT_250265 [Trichoderma compactum]